MNMLDRLLIRTIRATRAQFLATAMALLVGLMMYTAMSTLSHNMETGLARYYTRQGFAHLFAEMNPAPEAVVDDIQSTSGVARAEGRLVFETRAEPTPGARSTLRVVSYPQDHLLNRLHLVSGGLPEPAGGVSLALLEQYADANGLGPGDSITLFLRGEPLRARITGVVASPEFVYAIKDLRNIMPDYERFGVAFMPTATAQSIMGLEGRINSLTVLLEDESRASDLRKSLEDEFKYLGIRVMEREDQLSHAITRQKLDGIVQFSTVLPTIFVGIGAIVVYLMVSRMIEAERIPIGILMALGYSQVAITWHYVKYALLMGLAGAVSGTIAGYLLFMGIVPHFTDFFHIPFAQSIPRPSLYMAGAIAACVVCGVAGLLGASKATSISPTEAMRPPAPEAARPVPLEGLPVFWERLTATSRMVFRSVFRNWRRFAFASMAIALTYACVLVPLHTAQFFGKLLEKQFSEMETYDYTVTLSPPAGTGVVREIISEADASHAEPYVEQHLKLTCGWKEEFALTRAVRTDSRFFHLEGDSGRPVPVPERGILIPTFLAGKLGVTPGSVLQVSSTADPDRELEVAVAGVIKQYLGSTAYVSLGQMERITGEKAAVTGIALETGSDLKSRLDGAPNVEGVYSVNEISEAFEEIMETSMYSLSVMVLLGCIFGFAILFSTASISLSERVREFSTLRVLGFSRAEIFSIVLRENLAALVVGTVLGVPLAHALWVVVARNFSTEMYYLPDDALLLPHVWTLGVTAAFFASVMLAIWYRVKRLRFLDALKIRIT